MMPDREINDYGGHDTNCRFKSSGADRPILIEVISEGPHCVPCEYAIAAVEYVSEFYEGRIEVKVLETKRRADAIRYLELTRLLGGRLPVPAILLEGRLVFDTIPGPDELRRVLDQALAEWEGDR
jgi:thiol-disulfide isomerase/thioredoxin